MQENSLHYIACMLKYKQERKKMKTILIYGDSNTWEDNILTNKRIPREKRWPTILEKNK